jgi:hypothetical protein
MKDHRSQTLIQAGELESSNNMCQYCGCEDIEDDDIYVRSDTGIFRNLKLPRAIFLTPRSSREALHGHSGPETFEANNIPRVFVQDDAY